MSTTLADITPLLHTIASSKCPDSTMRELAAIWLRVLKENNGVPPSPEWQRVGELVEGFSKYEPNPQFCNTSAGMYDGHELATRTNDVLAYLWRSPSAAT